MRGLLRSGTFALLVMTAAVTPALAGPRDDVLYGISRCGGIADDRVWLNCLYGAAQPMRQQLGLPAAPPSQTQLVPPAMPGIAAPAMAGTPAAPRFATAEPTAPVKRRGMGGWWSKMWAAGNEPVVSGVMMASYRYDKKGFFTVTLADGQVWVQDSHEKIFAGWRGNPKQLVVSIVPDDDGILHLHVAGDDNSYIVKRG